MGDHEGSKGMRAGSWEGRRREEGEVPPPEAEEGGGSRRRRGGGAESLGERSKGAGKETGRGGIER
jgi:hypothetical protein